MASFWCLCCKIWTYFTPCSNVSLDNFEHWLDKKPFSLTYFIHFIPIWKHQKNFGFSFFRGSKMETLPRNKLKRELLASVIHINSPVNLISTIKRNFTMNIQNTSRVVLIFLRFSDFSMNYCSFAWTVECFHFSLTSPNLDLLCVR